MTYTWLLFDADETLFDYGSAEAAALERASRDRLGQFLPTYLPTYRRINTALWNAFEQGEIGRDQLRNTRFSQWLQAIDQHDDGSDFGEHYLRCLGERADLIPGALETVSMLRSRAKLALITNGFSAVQRSRLSRSPFRDWFAPVIISEEVGSSKPAAGIFEAAFSQMDNPDRSDVLLVGDSLTSDMAGGVSYGIDTCWFNPENRPRPSDLTVTYEIHALSELLAIVSQDAGERKNSPQKEA